MLCFFFLTFIPPYNASLLSVLTHIFVSTQDTARFKLSPDMGWGEVVGEVAKRLKVDASQVKLKYLDDEQEWMLLSTDQVSRRGLVAP
jgi:hypothetical protein